jgi:Fe-S cluster assembly protein SufD
LLEDGAKAHIVEEFAGPVAAAASPITHFTNSVAEFELNDAASLKHSYVQLEAGGTAHMKCTLVDQGRGSSYSLTEVRVGGSLSRHDLNIEQVGEATKTQMSSFLLCGDGQLHDLHSKLRLDHPNGEANQLHKCAEARRLPPSL